MRNSISITSGKGGVGKTIITSNIAATMARQGNRVLIFDTDLGLANMDVAFGVRPEKTILDFINGSCPIQDIIVEVHKNIYLLPATSGISDMDSIEPAIRMGIINAFNELEREFDVLLIDSAAGVSATAMSFVAAANKVVIVVNNDILSITDSFAMIKSLYKNEGVSQFELITNKMSAGKSEEIYMKLKKAMARFVPNTKIELVGNIEYSEQIIKSLNEQTPVALSNVDIKTNRSFLSIVNNLSTMEEKMVMRQYSYG